MFVLVAAVAFVFVALGHLEIAHRYPKGGGGVAAASEAFGPRVGVVSGALMVSAYLLTIAITVVTALHYIAVIRPFAYEIPVLSVVAHPAAGVAALGRRARAAARGAGDGDRGAALRGGAGVGGAGAGADASLAGALDQLRGHGRRSAGPRRRPGFAAAWLAFSGLESLGQLAPALREPRRRVIRIVAVLVVVSLVVTVPMFTVIAVEAAQASQIGPHPALLAVVAEAYGGRALLVALSLTGAGFLLVGANVAFIGCYNVFKAVGELGYLPAALAARNKRFGTPRGAIVVITAATVLLVITTGRRAVRAGQGVRVRPARVVRDHVGQPGGDRVAREAARAAAGHRRDRRAWRW